MDEVCGGVVLDGKEYFCEGLAGGGAEAGAGMEGEELEGAEGTCPGKRDACGL